MTPKPFSEHKFRQMTLETGRGTIYGLYTDLSLSPGTVPEGLFSYPLAWDEDGDDSIPTTIERAYAVCSFGILVVNSPLDFGGADNIKIDDWGFDEEDDKNCPEWLKKYLPDEMPESLGESEAGRKMSEAVDSLDEVANAPEETAA